MAKRGKKAKISFPLAALLVVLALIYGLFPDQLSGGGENGSPAQPAAPESLDGLLQVHFIDVGQADSILVLCDGCSLLVDGGNRGDAGTVASYLADQGVDRLDYVACTHAHEDHAGGLSGICHSTPADQALVPYLEADNTWFTDFTEVCAEQETPLLVPSAGDSFELGGATVQILGPLDDYNNVNDTSLVLRVVYGDTAFLLTGDATTTAERDLVDSGCDLSANVLKVGHHGSNGSTSYAFLRQVLPEYAVISVGADNDYGHPGADTLAMLEDAEAQVLRTDELGSIVCYSDGQELSWDWTLK